MNSWVCEEPGRMIHQELSMPKIGKGEILVQIHHIGICGTDIHAFEGTQPFFSYPRRLGHELGGKIIDSNGSKKFSNGETITIIPYFHCGKCYACRSAKTNCCEKLAVYGVHVDGGMVEYVSVPEDFIIGGRGLSTKSLAIVEPMSIGLHGIKRSGLGKGERVLVIGAGPIGILTGLSGALMGAEVYFMELNEGRLEKALELVEGSKRFVQGEKFGVVIDATGNLKAIESGIDYLDHSGKYILVGLQKEKFSFSHPEFHKREASLMSSRNATKEDFEKVIEWLESGKVPVEKIITRELKSGDLINFFQNKLLKEYMNEIKIMIEL
ncbi:MAG: hypothetical protein RIR51_1156 [Bacteroidota bacterium]